MVRWLLLVSILSFECKAHFDVIDQFLKPNPVILEAGAHDGSDTLKMISFWPHATIYSIEPVPELFNKLVAKTNHIPNIHCYQCALSNKIGRAPFYVSSGTSDASSSLLIPKDHLQIHQTVYFNNCITVQTVTLDAWAYAHHIDHIDFMWLDMQGHEFEMLKASTYILPTVKVIFIEASYQELYEGTALFPEVRQWLEQQGFVYICEFEENALFVRKSE